MAKSLTEQFGFFRSFFWPIHRHEFKKFIPMFLMLFFICFNYGILRTMKDTLIITASGATVLPYIKLWGIVPVAILLTFLFTRLTRWYGQEKIFYIITGGFLAFFLLFAVVLYPLRDVLHPYQSALYLQKTLPSGFGGLIELYKHWTLSLFYVIAELWSSVVLSTLFWGVANEVTKIKEAKRFYGVFGISSNFAAIVAGFAGNILSTSVSGGSWDVSVTVFLITVILCGLIILALFRWHSKTVLTPEAYPNLHKPSSQTSKGGKPSLRESFKLLSKSRYLAHIAILLISYNLVINLMDVIWKDRLHTLCPSPQAFNYYMNKITSMIGLLSLILTLFIPKLIERIGWTKTALITPIAMMVSATGFFSFLLFGNLPAGITMTAMTPLAVAVFFGGVQNCLSKAAKYSLFDATKEMTFIPLDHDVKLRGKAPIDVVGARLGKAGGSVIFQGLLLFLRSISACIPYVAVILTVVMAFWISATRNLGKMFNELIQSQSEEEEEEEEEPVPQEEQAEASAST